MKESLVEFKQKLPNLSKGNAKALKLLIEAGRLVAPLYKQQENDRYPGANFYPHDSTKAEIEKAAKKNPEILSAYTVVERKNGSLVATPYHIKYASFLKPIAEKLLKAAEVVEDKEYSKLLKLQAESLVEGDYEKALNYWLTMKPKTLSALIGPFKRYDDKLFHIKTSYQGWVGLTDIKETERVTEFMEAILTSRRKVVLSTQKVDFYDKVKVKVNNALLFSGFMAKIKFVGTFLPNNIEILEQHGAKILLFKQANTNRVEQEILPAFNEFFSSGFKSSFKKEDLAKGNMTYVFLHELAHTYLMYRSSEERLQDLYPIISELSASIYGMKVAGSLLLKDMVNSKEMESIMVSFMCRCLYLIKQQSATALTPHYVSGGNIFINYMIDSGALRFAEGFSIPNFMKMFVSVEEMSEILEKILATGTRKDAETFIKKYSKKLAF